MSTSTTADKIGRPFTHNGTQVQLVRDSYRASYPYPHTVVNFELRPTTAGKRSAAYLATRRELGDDWVTSLDDDPEGQVAAMRSAGLDDAEIAAQLDEARTLRNGGR